MASIFEAGLSKLAELIVVIVAQVREGGNGASALADHLETHYLEIEYYNYSKVSGKAKQHNEKVRLWVFAENNDRQSGSIGNKVY